ncbi:MAG: hypothetical protein KatS3mg101_1170 [Patescibacteria group bacterium]|nr:MAG: hypothetical protein KatS3mg101_1170 [Patescibacteria group bacterium]
MREPALMTVIGAKGTGKTYTTRKELAAQVKRGRKVLIYDASLDPELSHYRPIAPDYIQEYAFYKGPAIVRVPAIDKHGNELATSEKVELLKQILQSYRNGILLLEDFNKYVTDATELKELLGVITTNRHKNLDIILHYQSLRAVYTRIFQNSTIFRMHKDLESSGHVQRALERQIRAFQDSFFNYR